MEVKIYPKNDHLETSLKRFFCKFNGKLDGNYYFIFPEPYSNSKDFINELNDPNKVTNTVFIFLITEDEDSFQDYYADFVLFKYHYPSILIKIPHELDKNTLTNISTHSLENKQFLAFSDILEYYNSISEQFKPEWKWSGELSKTQGEFYRELAEASMLGENVESFLKLEHESMRDMLPDFDKVSKLYFQKDFSRNLLYYDRICQLNTSDQLECKRAFNILIVDDNIGDFQKILLEIKSMFTRNSRAIFEFYYPKGGWEYFTDLIQQNPEHDIKVISCNNIDENGPVDSKQVSDMDFVLLDLYFQGKQYTGEKILEQFNKRIPELPVFILTKSHDIDMIRKTFKLKADCFINKNRVVALPYYIYNFYQETGILLCCLEDKYRRPLLGCLRYWMQHSNFLWFGDKCYHMVNHSFDHTMNDWKIANQLLYPILLNNKSLISTDDLYCFCMAIWLHDIGHRGNKRYGAPHEIRDNHGIISGELILTQPELFRIYNPIKDYEGMNFPFGPMKKPVTQLIKERIKERGDKEPNIVEKIALMAIYHKSDAPLSKAGYRKMVNEEKYISKEYFNNSNRSEEEITLVDIMGKDNMTFLRMVALFRFIDGLDINKNRVGEYSEGDLKKKVIDQDKYFQLSKLREKVKFILKQNSTEEKKQDTFVRLSLIKIFYQDVKEKIDRGETVSHIELSKLVEDIGDLELDELDDYFMLLDHVSFLSVQDSHFNLHSFIDRIEIKHPNPSNPKVIEIHYYSNQPMKTLEETKVRELRKTDRPIKQHLIGTKEEKWEDSYVFKEIKGVDLLETWFDVKNIRIFLHDSSGKIEPEKQ